MYAEQAQVHSNRAKRFFFKDKEFQPANTTSTARERVAHRCAARPERSGVSRDSVRTVHGGAERDRTADPLLAKQVLSQLSYSPIRFALTCRAPFGLALRGRAERSATTYRSV